MRLPTNNDKESKRTDIDRSNGRAWSVSVRPDKVKGGWMVFVKFCRKNDTEAKLFLRSIHCKERQDIGKAIAELLRMADKLGFDSPMADGVIGTITTPHGPAFDSLAAICQGLYFGGDKQC